METLTALPGDQIASLIYLVAIAGVIAGWLIVSLRGNIGKLAQYAAIWTFIFLGAIVATGLWPDIRHTVTPRQSVLMDGARVEVPQALDGHYYVTLEVNGAPIRFVVDTGATDMVLSRDDAVRAGLNPEALVFSGRAFTANGVVDTAPVTLDSVVLGKAVDARVAAVVNGADMQDSLLGMTYLQRFERIEISGGRLVLER